MAQKKKDKQRSTKHRHKNKTKVSHIMNCVNCIIFLINNILQTRGRLIFTMHLTHQSGPQVA